MKPAKKYASAGAIRRALEDRLRQTATAEHVDLARLRRQVAFDRLLARLFHSDEAPWALKGGYAMELQLRVARTTVDIDLTLPASLNLSSEEAPATAAVREMLQEAASLDLGDWFVYTVGAPMMANGQTIRTIAREAGQCTKTALSRRIERCTQRLTETHVFKHYTLRNWSLSGA
jgi:hypothetical protein